MTILELNKRFRTYFPFNAPVDMLLTMMKGPTNAVLDIIKLDDLLARYDSDYNPNECTYKDQKKVSMSEYIKIKYGEDAVKFIQDNTK